jgi:hypothetical protein
MQIIEAVIALVRPERITLIGTSALLAAKRECAGIDDIIEKSLDADLLIEPCEERKMAVAHEAVGEDSLFHKEYGIFADILRLNIVETFPAGWEKRCIHISEKPLVQALHPHDIAAMKLVLGREKDVAFLASAVRARLISMDQLRSAYNLMNLGEKELFRISRTLHRVEKSLGGDAQTLRDVPPVVRERKAVYNARKTKRRKA